MENGIKIITGPRTEDQRNRERIGLMKVAMRYPIGHKSRELLLKHIAESYR